MKAWVFLLSYILGVAWLLVFFPRLLHNRFDEPRAYKQGFIRHAWAWLFWHVLARPFLAIGYGSFWRSRL